MKKHPIKQNTSEFFEGWYFKHQANGQTIALIPGFHIPKHSKAFAFIQVITNDGSFFIKYPYSQFYASKNSFYIKIRNNIFSKNGISININTPTLKLQGNIRYEKFTPIKYNIMGPFSLIPNMECNHGIISLHHLAHGYLMLNNTFTDLNHSVGYIEKDWGSSFPKAYTWLQCNDFNDKTSILVSIAHIPFCSFSFQGLIAIVYYKGKEYRFATYNGGKVIHATKHFILIKKGSYYLKATISPGTGHPLKAPSLGDMSRIIHERPSCFVTFEFFNKDKKIFKKHSRNASFEYVD